MGDRVKQTHSSSGDNVAGDKYVYLSPQPPEPTIAGPPNNLGSYGLLNNRFVGRSQALVELHQRFEASDRLAIVGMGGLGKSALAIAYGLRHQDEYLGGLGYFSAANFGAEVVSFVQAHLGQNFDLRRLKLREQVAICWQDWQKFCGGTRRALVIIDNVDPADFRENIAPYLPPLGSESGFRVLLTARSLLGASLGWPELGLEPLNPEESRELLRAIVGEERLAAEPAAVEAIGVRLAGLPLALELVASWLRLDPDLKVAELLAGLKAAGLQALKQRSADSLAERGLWECFQLSWQGLDGASQQLARLVTLLAPVEMPWELVAEVVAAYAPPIAPPLPRRRKRDRLWAWLSGRASPRPEVAIAPVPNPLPTIAEALEARGCLLQTSLLQRVESETYRVHPLLREFFAAQWPGADREGWWRALARVAVQRAQALPQQPTWQNCLDFARLRPHLEAASAHLLEFAKTAPPEVGKQARAQADQITLPMVRLKFPIAFETTFRKATEDHARARKTGQAQDFATALAGYRAAVDQATLALPPNSFQRAGYLRQLAKCLEDMGHYSEAIVLADEALNIVQAKGTKNFRLADYINTLGWLYNLQGEHDRAEPLLERSLAIREQVLGADHPDTATSLNNLASLYESQGRYAEAEPLFRRSLAIGEQVLGANHPHTATSLNNLALLYESQGRKAEAEHLFRRSLAISGQVLGADHPETATSLNNLAALYNSQGRYAEAELLFRRCVEIFLEKLGQDHPNTQTGQKNFRRFVQTVAEAGRTADLSNHPLTQSILQQIQSPPPPNP